MVLEITSLEISKRLQTLGYMQEIEFGIYPEQWSEKDKYLISYSIQKGMQEVANYLNRNLDDFVEAMKPFVIDIICSLFLSSKRDIGINEDGSITPTGDIKTIKEDTLAVEYDVSNSTSSSSSQSPLDEMLQHLREDSYQALQNYRYWYCYQTNEENV